MRWERRLASTNSPCLIIRRNREVRTNAQQGAIRKKHKIVRTNAQIKWTSIGSGLIFTAFGGGFDTCGRNLVFLLLFKRGLNRSLCKSLTDSWGGTSSIGGYSSVVRADIVFFFELTVVTREKKRKKNNWLRITYERENFQCAAYVSSRGRKYENTLSHHDECNQYAGGTVLIGNEFRMMIIFDSINETLLIL